MNGIDEQGVWWLPNDETTMMSGRLQYTPNNFASLHVIGTWLKDEPMVRVSADPADISEESEALLADIAKAAAEAAANETTSDAFDGHNGDRFPTKIAAVHGVIDGAAVTLLGLSESWRGGGSIPGYSQHTFNVDTVLRGAHVPVDDNGIAAPITGAQFSFEHLDDWCGTALANEDDSDVTQARSCNPATGAELTLTYRRLHNTSFNEDVKQRHAVFHLTLDHGASISDLLDNYIQPLQDFLTCVTGEAQAITNLNIGSPQVTWNKQERWFEVGCANLSTSPSGKKLMRYNIIAPLADIDFATVIPKWFEVRSTYRVPMDFALGAQYGGVKYPEMRLITAATAAEALHNTKYKPKRTPFTSNEAAVDAVLATFDESERTLLMARLQHLNDPSLHDRLLELVTDYGDFLGECIVDRDAWVQKLKKARNDIAHGAKTRLDGAAAFALSEMLGRLIELIVLTESGCDREMLKKRFQESGTFAWYIDLRTQYLDPIIRRE